MVFDLECDAQIEALRAALRKVWAPKVRQTLVDWAYQNIKLSAKTAAEPGPLDFGRTPYVKQIAEEIDNPRNTCVVWVAGAQVSKTTLLSAAALRDVVEYGNPAMLVLSTIGLAEGYSKERLQPTIKESLPLLAAFGDSKARDGRNTIRYKEALNGGHLILIGSNSSAELRSRPIQRLYLDEVSSYAPNKEGDVVNLLKQRQVTFFDRTTVMASTPVFAGDRIESEYFKTDQRKLFVLCHNCKTWDYLRWSGVKYQDKNPATAHYQCENCQATWSEYQRTKAIQAGEWRSTATPSPGFERTPGFHLSALYSPWLSLEQLVSEWLECQGDRLKLQTFTNTKLAEGFQISEFNDLDPTGLQSRAEPYEIGTVPQGGLLLTAGVDVQSDRLVVSIYAWGRGEECWLVDHYLIYGNPLLLPGVEGSPWPGLDIALEAYYPKAQGQGQPIRIALTNIDSGYATNEVYRYVLTRQRKFKVRAVDGRAGAKPIVNKATYPQVDAKGGTKKKGGVQLWPIGVDLAKRTIYGRLAIPQPGPRFIHFPEAVQPYYYQEITAEQITIKYKQGFPSEVWELKPGRENHALDCFVYSLAAAHHLRIDSPQYPWHDLEETEVSELGSPVEPSGWEKRPTAQPKINKITGKPHGTYLNGHSRGTNQRKARPTNRR